MPASSSNYLVQSNTLANFVCPHLRATSDRNHAPHLHRSMADPSCMPTNCRTRVHGSAARPSHQNPVDARPDAPEDVAPPPHHAVQPSKSRLEWKVLDHVFAHVVTDGIGIPNGPAQQMLHAVRAGLPGPL